MLVSIQDQQIHLGVLIAAARQDQDHTTSKLETDCRVHGGNHHGAIGWRIESNGDSATAGRYRQILRDLLPDLKSKRDKAYARYTHPANQRTTERRLDGHGSWVSGPALGLQEKWQSLADAVAEVEAAISEAGNA